MENEQARECCPVPEVTIASVRFPSAAGVLNEPGGKRSGATCQIVHRIGLCSHEGPSALLQRYLVARSRARSGAPSYHAAHHVHHSGEGPRWARSA